MLELIGYFEKLLEMIAEQMIAVGKSAAGTMTSSCIDFLSRSANAISDYIVGIAILLIVSMLAGNAFSPKTEEGILMPKKRS